MGLFRKPSRTVSSSASESSSFSTSATSSNTSTSLASSAAGKVKPSDLQFPVNSAAPNSRILAPPPDPNSTSPKPKSAAALAPPTSSSAGRNGNSAVTGSAPGQPPSGQVGLQEDDEDDAASSSGSEHFDDADDGGENPAVEEAFEKLSVQEPKEEVQRDKSQMSKAARLVAEKMEEEVSLRKKLGKPLASLTAQDVALTEEDIATDMSTIWKAMHLFMSSRMIEAEEICLSGSDHRLYYSVGYALIQSIKSLATFEPEDLEAAIQCCRDSIHITQLLRKKDHGLFERVGSIAKGTTSVHSIKTMTLVQRHAELVYAECTLLKAVLGIIYSGDFLAFLKEALNMRNAYAIYRTLAKYVEGVDEAYGGEDPVIDQDFRSGVHCGNGMISLILSLLPSTVLKIMEVFGFTGDREWALATLMKAGGWRAGVEEPGMDPEKEGIRRPICDMVLLMHHLVIANYLPVGGVDVSTASNILKYNLDRYPTGIFFLYFAGRLHSTRTELDEATRSFQKAIQAQREYIQLGHICYWDIGLVALAGGDWTKGYECFNLLDKESNWSKAVYAYAKATTLYEAGIETDAVNAAMASVPNLLQRVAGKSIPIEKFVARRARKFVAQGNRLALPGVELAYVLNCLGLSPRGVLFEKHLDQVSLVLKELHAVADPKAYGQNGDEYYDDFCLAHLLRGIILRFMAHPEPHVNSRPKDSPIPVEEADEQALISFNNVVKHGKDIVVDHHLVWFAHYELGQLYRARGEWVKARQQYEQVMSGKGLEISSKKGKGKVSLQNMAVLRSNSALEALKEQGH
ncbi:hypothetical protein JCM8097_009449 [Rhodosporidiobolus ruineniae]